MSSGAAARLSRSLLTHAQRWYEINAAGQPVGRLAAYLSGLLQGKSKPIYEPSTLCGDVLVVLNAEQVIFTGRKWKQKLYRHHTGAPRGFKQITAERLHERQPTEVLRRAVFGMLPKNGLRKHWMRQLYLIEGKEHPYKSNILATLAQPAEFKPKMPPLFQMIENPDQLPNMGLPEGLKVLQTWEFDVPDPTVLVKKKDRHRLKAATAAAAAGNEPAGKKL